MEQTVTIPSAPGVPTFLFSRLVAALRPTRRLGTGSRMSGTFLSGAGDVHSGTTTIPASAAAWNWLVITGVTQMTNNLVPRFGNCDQPWLSGKPGPNDCDAGQRARRLRRLQWWTRCAGSGFLRCHPAQLHVDNQSGTSTGGVDPRHRLAVDPQTGFVYSLFRRWLRQLRRTPRTSTSCLTDLLTVAPHGP